jgi:hypothetical protein
MDSAALLLFNDALVTCRLPIDNISLNVNPVIRVFDLNTIWIAEEPLTPRAVATTTTTTTASSSSPTKEQNAFYFKTPESKHLIVAIDSFKKQYLIKIIQQAINALVSPNKNKKIEFIVKKFENSLRKSTTAQYSSHFATNTLQKNPLSSSASPSSSSPSSSLSSSSNFESHTTSIQTDDSHSSSSSIREMTNKSTNNTIQIDKSNIDSDPNNKQRYAKFKFSTTHSIYPDCVYEGEWFEAEVIRLA